MVFYSEVVPAKVTETRYIRNDNVHKDLKVETVGKIIETYTQQYEHRVQ